MPESRRMRPLADIRRSGAAYIVGSAFAFSVMTVLVKVAGERLPSQEIVLARAVVSLALSYCLLLRAGVDPWGRARRLLLGRGVLGFLALSCVYYAVTHLPLAEATVLQYLHPTFTAVLAAFFLRERLSPTLLLVTVLSLAGVVLVSKPQALFSANPGSLDPFAVTVALGGAFLSGLAYVVVRTLSKTEHPLVIVFYFPLIAVPASLPVVWKSALWPSWGELVVLLGVGIASQIGQVWLTRGLVCLPASRATAISYLQVVFATIWGVVVFAEVPDVLAVTGALMVVGGALVIALRGGEIPEAA